MNPLAVNASSIYRLSISSNLRNFLLFRRLYMSHFRTRLQNLFIEFTTLNAAMARRSARLKTFHLWSRLPSELQLHVLSYFLTKPEPINGERHSQEVNRGSFSECVRTGARDFTMLAYNMCASFSTYEVVPLTHEQPASATPSRSSRVHAQSV